MSIYLLSDSFYEGVINLPQIKILFKDVNLDLCPYKALIFSSKNGVRAVDRLNHNWKNIPSYAIGRATAREIEKLGGRLDFVSSSSYGNDFAKEISAKLKNKNALFLRAKVVLSDLEKILETNGVNISSKIVYETICNEKIALHVNNKKVAFIFTSPSTVECFLSRYDWLENYTAVCIGDVTAKAFPKNIPLHVSKIQSIEACIEFAKTIIKQN